LKIVAKTLVGLEEVLANEIKNLGGRDVVISNRAVTYTGSKEILYRSNYFLRTATRLLVPIYTFTAKTQHAFEKNMEKHNWDHYLTNELSFAIDAQSFTDIYTHSKFLALKTKDIIVDQFREKTGDRPNVNTLNPDVRFQVHAYRDEFIISLDSSGQSLHKRGYRVRAGFAPLSEVLGAGLVLLSGWDGSKPFLDPMCGSGTIAIEAALYALGRSPHEEDKSFGFMGWKNFDMELWNKIKAETLPKFENFSIKACDSHMAMVRATKDNAIGAEVQDHITVERQDFFRTKESGPHCIISNPPYDEKIPLLDAFKFYRKIGDTFKRHFAESEAWLLSGNIEALKKMGLKTSKRIELMNGPIEARFHKFEMYEGS